MNEIREWKDYLDRLEETVAQLRCDKELREEPRRLEQEAEDARIEEEWRLSHELREARETKAVEEIRKRHKEGRGFFAFMIALALLILVPINIAISFLFAILLGNPMPELGIGTFLIPAILGWLFYSYHTMDK